MEYWEGKDTNHAVMTAFGCKLLLCLPHSYCIRAIPDWRSVLFKDRHTAQQAAFPVTPAGGPWCPGHPRPAPEFHGEAAAPGDCSAGSPPLCLLLQHHRTLRSPWQLTGTHRCQKGSWKMLPPEAATTKPHCRSLAATAGLYGSTGEKRITCFSQHCLEETQ